MIVKELHKLDEMLAEFDVVKELYPELERENYKLMLAKMLKNSYFQIAIYQDEKCIAISGVWLGTKVWCGDFLELDNIVVLAAYRSSGAGKLIFQYAEQKAKDLNCTIMCLDSYTSNFKAHKFFYNQGFGPKGFHFVNILNSKGIN